MASPKTFGRDRGLQARMTMTMLLLGLVYAVLIGVLFAVHINPALMGGIAVVLLLMQYFSSEKLAMFSMGAKEVSPQEAPQLHAMVERLCIEADLPKPRVAIAQTSMPNAFAMGRSPKRAVVCATTGIMETLEPQELEGVLAHE